MIEEMTSDYEALLVQWRDAGAIVERMLAARKPVVSAINGVAVGAGLAVALLADVSVCAESARLSDGHVRLGVAAGDHAALLWPTSLRLRPGEVLPAHGGLHRRARGGADRARHALRPRRPGARRGPRHSDAPGEGERRRPSSGPAGSSTSTCARDLRSSGSRSRWRCSGSSVLTQKRGWPRCASAASRGSAERGCALGGSGTSVLRVLMLL